MVGGSLGGLIFVMWLNIECYRAKAETVTAERRGEVLLICPAYFAASEERSLAASLLSAAAAFFLIGRRRHQSNVGNG